jgi:orotate phosphoribosyltransferase
MPPPSVAPDDLGRRIYERSHLHGEFVLRSGRVSKEYFDKYLFEGDPALLRDVGEAMVPLLPKGVDALAGLELGGVPLVTMLAQLTGLPALFVRKAAKEYGTRRLAEGGGVSGRRLVVVEDVVCTGGQLVESCAALRRAGAEVAAVLCAIDRESGGAENLALEGLSLRSAFTWSQLRASVVDRVERSRDIVASPELVYAAISDITRMGEWSDECYACEWLRGFHEPVVGAMFDGHNRNGARQWTSQCKVIQADPGRAFAFECSMDGFHYSTWGYRIEPCGPGSRVTEWSQDLRPEEALELSRSISGRAERADRNGSAERNRRSMSWTLDRLADALERSIV